MAGKIEVTWPLAFAADISRIGMSWFLLLNAISASFIRRNYRVFGSFDLTKGTIEQNATEPAYVAYACTSVTSRNHALQNDDGRGTRKSLQNTSSHNLYH